MTTITLYVEPPATDEIGGAYTRLVLGLAQHWPHLLDTYIGPPEWVVSVDNDPASLEALRTHAVAVATATQRSDLPQTRRDRILRNSRALIWLIRAALGETLIFSEQVRLLLDLQPESLDETVIEQAQQTLADQLDGSGELVDRWASWQADYTLPLKTARPLIKAVLAELSHPIDPTLLTIPLEPIDIEGAAPPTYRQAELRLPQQSTLRVDRLYHFSAQWLGQHLMQTASARRYASGEIECATTLAIGPEQPLRQGVGQAILDPLPLYEERLPKLLHEAGLPAIDSQALQTIHLAEAALRWVSANAAILLHGERLRPRAIRRYLMANGLLDKSQAEQQLERLADPLHAAHIFAPLIGQPLIKSWLERTGHPLTHLLDEPPVPSKMMFDIRFE